MNSPEVTVVIAAYNHSAYARRAVRSVAEQDFDGPIQLIVTDDASQDASQHVMDAALSEMGLDARRVYHSVNQGVCKTFNDALALATGRYICFLAADDWMRPDRLRRQVDALNERPDLALCYSDMTMVNEVGDETGERYSDIVPEDWGFYDTDHCFERLLVNNWIPAPSVMMRTECIRGVGGYDSRLVFEDQEMWLRLSSRWPITMVPETLVYYRQVGSSLWNSLMTDRSHEMHEGVMLMLRRHRPTHDHGEALRIEYSNAQAAYLMGTRASAVLPSFLHYARASGRPSALFYCVIAALRIPGPRWAGLRSTLRA